MKLPIASEKLSIIVIGDPVAVVQYGSTEPKLTKDGKPLFRVPVLISGTGERVDPSTTITVVGPLPQLPKGSPVRIDGLCVASWTIRDAQGRERTGITLRADRIEARK